MFGIESLILTYNNVSLYHSTPNKKVLQTDLVLGMGKAREYQVRLGRFG